MNLGYIESIQTSAKTVICFKISPKFEGVPNTDTLPVSAIINVFKMLRYVLHTCNPNEDPPDEPKCIDYHNILYLATPAQSNSSVHNSCHDLDPDSNPFC